MQFKIFLLCMRNDILVQYQESLQLKGLNQNSFIMLHRLSLCTFRYFSSVKAYNPAKNYYKVLNLSESASQKDIKRSFRELAKKYHPDSTKGKEEAFKEVNEAYQVLSDESIKRNYDEERRISDTSSHAHNSHNHNHHSHNGYHGQAYNHNHNQSHSHGHNAQYNQAHSNYRGYQREEGWQNRNFREQFMYDLHRAQQADYQRNFDPSERARYEREFRQNMQRATRGASETIRQYTEAAKQKQAQARKQYEADEKARQEQEKEYFRQYRDYQTHHDINEKMKQKLNKIADDIAGNIKQVLSVTDELKNIWNNIKKKK